MRPADAAAGVDAAAGAAAVGVSPVSGVSHVPGTDADAHAQATQPGNASDARIAHLFRATRRLGLIHPLQHLLQRYRTPQGGGAP